MVLVNEEGSKEETLVDDRLPWNWVLYYGEVVQAGDGYAGSCTGE